MLFPKPVGSCTKNISVVTANGLNTNIFLWFSYKTFTKKRRNYSTSKQIVAIFTAIGLDRLIKISQSKYYSATRTKEFYFVLCLHRLSTILPQPTSLRQSIYRLYLAVSWTCFRYLIVKILSFFKGAGSTVNSSQPNFEGGFEGLWVSANEHQILLCQGKKRNE